MGTQLYQLANACPINWPVAPKYPVDKTASSPVKRDGSQSPAKSDILWLRRSYLDALYARTGSSSINERLKSLGEALRKRRDTVAEALQTATLALEAFDRKYRPDVLKSVEEDTEGPLPTDEQAALKAYLAAARQSDGDAKGSKKSARDLFAGLEVVEVKLQVMLLLELLSRRQSGVELSLDPDPVLRMYTDRLVIHQALSGLDAAFGADKQNGQAIELDDVQLFWQSMENIHLPLMPPVFVELIRSKLFNGASLAKLGVPEGTQVVASPMHHSTPDLKKLAQAVSDAAAENAANRIPESPTLAKFIANPAGGSTSFAARPFARSRSTLSTTHLSSRQIEMGGRPAALAQPTARPNKRKAIEPERIAPASSAHASQVLVGATPKRAQGRILAAETPVREPDADAMAETPA